MLIYFIIPCLQKSQNLHGKSKNQKTKNIRFLQKHVGQNACSWKCKNFDPLRVLDFFAQKFFFCHSSVDPSFVLFFVLDDVQILSKVSKKPEFGHLVVGQLLRAHDSNQEQYSYHFLCFIILYQENSIFICKPEMPKLIFVRGPFKLSIACRFFVQLNRVPWDEVRKKNDLHRQFFMQK